MPGDATDSATGNVTTREPEFPSTIDADPMATSTLSSLRIVPVPTATPSAAPTGDDNVIVNVSSSSIAVSGVTVTLTKPVSWSAGIERFPFVLS